MLGMLGSLHKCWVFAGFYLGFVIDHILWFLMYFYENFFDFFKKIEIRNTYNNHKTHLKIVKKNSLFFDVFFKNTTDNFERINKLFLKTPKNRFSKNLKIAFFVRNFLYHVYGL